MRPATMPPKKQRKQPADAAAQAEAAARDAKRVEEEEEDDDEDDEDDEAEEDDDDREALNLGTEDATEPLSIDFGFFDPKSSDFHGMRALLLSGTALMPAGSTWDISGLADVLSEQVEVGSVAKTIGEGSEEPADDDVLGFMSAVNLQVHRTKLFAQEMRASILKRCPDASAREELSRRFDDPRVGLIVSERMINLPAALVPSLIDSMLQDIAWAAENAEDKATRDALNFSELLLIAAVTLKPGNGAGGNGSSGGPIGAGASSSEGGASGGGKRPKKRERQAAAASAQAALFETVEFVRTEEEILAATAEWQALLNGTGRTRQMVLALTPEGMRQAIPALHAAMGEDA